VIVLDEAQTVPPRLLAPILDVLRALVQDYGASVVVCTATQPAWTRDVVGEVGLEGVRELAPSLDESFDALRRVRVRWPEGEAPTSLEALARELTSLDDVMAIVHTRRDARALAELVGDEAAHLSARMCPAHRRAVLTRIRDAKAAGSSVRLVATQLVEAGVDLDFRVVYRALGGIDAMAQAAGRCNREGRLGREGGELRVFHAESPPPRGVPTRALQVSLEMLRASASEGPGLDLFDPRVYREYFTRLYRHEGDLDPEDLQALRASLRFRDVAESFAMIDEYSAPVLVPYGDCGALVTELEAGALRPEGPRPGLYRRLQQFAVNVPRATRDQWIAEGIAREVAQSVVVIDGIYQRGAYSERFGLLQESLGVADVDALIA
jgi:CRISPR-associated endonuclease/helicase Cas3